MTVPDCIVLYGAQAPDAVLTQVAGSVPPLSVNLRLALPDRRFSPACMLARYRYSKSRSNAVEFVRLSLTPVKIDGK